MSAAHSDAANADNQATVGHTGRSDSFDNASKTNQPNLHPVWQFFKVQHLEEHQRVRRRKRPVREQLTVECNFCHEGWTTQKRLESDLSLPLEEIAMLRGALQGMIHHLAECTQCPGNVKHDMWKWPLVPGHSTLSLKHETPSAMAQSRIFGSTTHETAP